MSKKRWNAAALWCILLLAFLFGSCPQQKSASEPEKDPYPIPADAVSVEITVSDSVSGTVVDGTKLVVFDSDGKQVTNQLTVRKGKVTAKVSPKKKYDFVLLGKKGTWAGSRLQDYYVPEEGLKGVMMLQFAHGQITRDVTPPHIDKVTIENASGVDITDNYDIGNAEKKVYVEFTSKVGAVEDVAWNGFGAKLGFGMMPTSYEGIDGVYTPDNTPGDGIFTSKYVFDIEHAAMPDDKTELIIVGYDVANNRVEKRIPVKFSKTSAAAPLSNAKFGSAFMIIERVPFTNNTFSTEPGQGLVQLDSGHEVMPQALNPVEGHNSSYMAVFVFGVVDKTTPTTSVPIMGFDVFRKEKGSTDTPKFVSRTHYDEPKTETNPGWGAHQGFDTSSELEEGKEYVYTIKAFTATDTLESPVFTGKVMEAFTYSLKAPENRKKISAADAANMSYSCTISNKKLLTKEEADWCDLGLLILDGQGQPVFGSKFRYVFDGVTVGIGGANTTTGPDLLIDTIGFGSGVKRFSYKKQLATPLQTYYNINKLEDLITVDSSTGIITITDKFVKIAQFNVAAGTPMEYQSGVNYQWDIQDWGKSAISLRDDRALRIVKMYDSNQSRTMGNNSSSGSNAVNGRFTFVIE
ncbi:dentilisin complex subunit PrcA [Treponema sp. B152]|uniref:PrcA n=1 Tax=Treponema denticola ASLM TaxID=999427 RepID=K4MW43_TREDN|nr:dentilisin complex subunit PrcA [Treponema sp. B152]AFV33673.1 PrcA [Treponema denticola ASLM]UTD10676.1 dentilisin complex subunit PrcA [Treponema sp. B152]